jgi:hypothetical protein
LQAVSSRKRYSLHGLLALMRPDAGLVCQSLMVVSNWTPGSAQAQAASATCFQRPRALTVRATSPVVRQVRFQSPSLRTASMNSWVTRTELFEFWPETVA